MRTASGLSSEQPLVGESTDKLTAVQKTGGVG
jgi:hypothetical protein